MTSIRMPQLGETIVEGTILRWLKAVGDDVALDEPLFEISTDKVDTEVPSPVAGKLAEVLVAEGETVAVKTEVARIEEAGGSGEDGGKAEVERAAEEPAGAEAEAASEAAPPSEPSPRSEPAKDGGGDQGGILSPVVRRLVAEHGVDLAAVTGTGRGGRITRKDVEAAVAAGAGTGNADGSPAPAPRPTAPSTTAGDADEVVPLSHIRRAIGAHMLASVQTSAQAWTMVEADVENLVRLRARAKDEFLAAHGVKLTYLPFIVRAVTDALLAFPQVNARLDGEQLVLHRSVAMGIAVSYDEGLIVPVVRGTETMNVVGLARALADLAARARSHDLKPDEVQGATFTITNPGVYGSLVSVPIINQPNSGILSLDAIKRRPVVVGDDAIGIRSMVYLSMSWDHRVIDGELATRFLVRIKENLETWDFDEDLGL